MRFIFSFTLLILPLLLFAQPANDDCSNVISVNIDDCLIYDNMNANPDVGFVNFNPPGLTCNPTANEVWFAFTAPPAGSDGIEITVTGVSDGGIPALNQPSVAVILGDCSAMFMEAISCQEAAAGDNTVQFVLPGDNLIPFFTYYVIVSGWSATATLNEGAFEFCVETYEPPADICSGSPATITDCVGLITDSGGDNGDYSSNENCVFTINPTVFNQCIVATVNFYDTENFNDFINFYDGPNTASPQIQALSGVGANIEVQASSGALTIEFTSNGSVESSGFEIEWACTTEECTVLAPIAVESDVTIDDLVDALSSPQVIVENPVLNCPDGGYGTYTSPGNTQLEVMGLGEGIILSTGFAEDVENPEGFFANGNFFSPGDADLDALSPNSTTNDACVLEFDVYAATDELLFQYVFGSEEYPNFVNTDWNDIFAFFISGPGIGSNVNIAVLGDGVTPVEINTVNDVNPGAQFDPVTGAVIYNNNSGGVSLPYGGYTSVLTAQANVIPCNYYHLKLAIADRGDTAYDSGVFLADLQAGLPELDLVFEINSTTGENILVEGCSNNDFISATLTNPDPTDTIVYYLQVEGIADENTDLTSPIPDSLLAPPGETILQIPVIPTVDLIDEGVESFGLQVFAVFQCDTVIYDSVSIVIYDEIDIEPSQDTFFVCTGTSVQLEVGGATGYTWGWPIASELNNPNIFNPTLTPSQSGYIMISGIINGNSNCVDTDSAYIQIIDPVIDIITPSPSICENESISLQAMTNTNNTGISWSPVQGLSCSDCPNPIASPSSTTTYTATVTAGGCTDTDDITITVAPLGIPNLINETLICEGSSISLATAPTGTGITTSHLWSPNDGSLDDITSPTPIATPAVTTTYTVVSTNDTGTCINTQSVTINVTPVTIDITGPDTIYLCNDALSPITLNTTSIVMPEDIGWSDNNGGSYPNGASLNVNPSENITYYATITIGSCTNYDSVVIQIDSIPDFILDVSVPSQSIALSNPDTVDVCSDPSESFLVTNLYNSTSYPDLEHEWTINGNAYNPVENGANLLDNLPLSISNYVLTSHNNACLSLDSFVIDVNTPPNFAITPSSATICIGDNVQLEATGTNNFTWNPDDGSLSDININNPIATPSQTTTYTAYSEVAGCQAGVSMTVTVLEMPSISLVSGATICQGEQKNLGLGTSDPNATYTWSPNNFVSGDGTANPVAAPLVTTTYSVTVSNGVCNDFVDDVTITVNNDLPLEVSGESDICLGESTTLFANTQGAVNWYNANGTLMSTGPTLVLTPTAVGSTMVTAEAFNTFCSSTKDFTVNVDVAPTLSVSADQDICADESVDISATTDTGTLVWAPENEFADPTLATQTVSPNGTTTYIVTADNNGCEVSGNVTINVSDAPIYGVRDDVAICAGEPIGIGLLNDANTTYSWTANPTDPSLIDTNIGNPVVSPSITTTYTLTATNGLCVETDQMTITVTNPNIVIISDTICPGENATLIANATPQGGIVTWTNSGGTVVGSGNSLSVAPLTSTSYIANYDFNGCFASTIGNAIVIDGPSTNLVATATQIIAGESTTLTLEGVPSDATLAWTDLATDLDLPETTSTVTVAPVIPTDYLVSVTTIDGCVYESYISIDVLFQDLKMPNIFTPNGDGTNDEFYPIFSDLALDLLEFKVFDRWGELVHDDISSGWDGRFKGKNLPSDIYVYFFRVRFNDGTEQFQKGDIALMR